MYCGVSKSGSPAPKAITGRPCARYFFANASISWGADGARPPSSVDNSSLDDSVKLKDLLVALSVVSARPCLHPTRNIREDQAQRHVDGAHHDCRGDNRAAVLDLGSVELCQIQELGVSDHEP